MDGFEYCVRWLMFLSLSRSLAFSLGVCGVCAMLAICSLRVNECG